MSSIASIRPASRALASPQGRAVVMGFASTLLAALVLATAIGVVIGVTSQGRALSGISVGGISVGGLRREQIEQRLASRLPPIDTGVATLVIGDEQVQASYRALGRHYDLAAMSDEAYGTGRSGNPLTMLVARLHDWLVGTSLRPQVHGYDKDALDEVAVRVAVRYSRPPVDALVTATADGSFAVTPAAAGARVDPRAVRAVLGAALQTANADDIRLQIPVIPRPPKVTTAQAQAATALADAMTSAPLSLKADGDPFALAPTQLARMIRFGADAEGTYTAVVDLNALDATVSSLAKRIDRPAQDASYSWGASLTVVPAKNGRKLDQQATANLLATALAERATGLPNTGAIQLQVAVTTPKLTTQAAAATIGHIVRIGTWTTYYVPGISNGYGANINIPAQVLNGKVIAPGETFDFWRDIGPVTLARGYQMGGAIINGKSEHTGAIGGGICSASTTMFNAALRAGLQMGERWNHYYYIGRYPVGLDATVFADYGQAWSMSWTNDTPYPVIIRSYTAWGIVTFSLYSVPTGRTVTLTTPITSNYTYGHDTYEYTTSLAPGVQKRLEPIYNGFDAVVTRYVRDWSGKLIHTDTYYSHYHAVNGIVLVGAASTGT